jgi:hypothetical protein
MSAAEKIAMTHSPEAELLRHIEDLIRKLAGGNADDNDLQLLHELQRQRLEMMRPKVLKERVPA